MSHASLRHASCRWALLLGGALCLLATAAGADEADAPNVDVSGNANLTGHQIYERVVANRFASFAQQSKLISADRAGRTQESRFEMKWQDFRDKSEGEQKGILSKTMVRYSHPFDLRHAGYYILSNADRANDQFVYYPSRRRVARVSLRNEAVYGTDFSFEDVVPREAEDFHSERLPDAVLDGAGVFVVDLSPRKHIESEYSRIRVYVDQKRSVVVHARYWDEARVEIKQMLAPASEIRDYDGVYVPMRSTMRNLLIDSETTLVITEINANPEFDSDIWNLRRLEGH